MCVLKVEDIPPSQRAIFHLGECLVPEGILVCREHVLRVIFLFVIERGVFHPVDGVHSGISGIGSNISCP